MPALSLLIKPLSGNCNMHCKYCFHADKLNNREGGSAGMMSAETMHSIVDKTLAFGENVCTFAFQGGEPMLIGLDFFGNLSSMWKYARKETPEQKRK